MWPRIWSWGAWAEGERVRAMFFLPRGPQGKVPATLIADANWGGDEPGALAQGLLQAGGAVLIVAPFLTDGTEREGHDEAWILCTTRTIRRRWLAGCRTSSRGWPIWTSTCAWASATSSVRAKPASGACLRGRWLVTSAAPRWTGVVDLGDDEAWSGALFAPGIRALGDVRTALALCAPGRLLVHGAGDHFPERVARRCYRAAGKGTQLVVEAEGMSEDAIVEWIN